jgi:hypothetical protein
MPDPTPAHAPDEIVLPKSGVVLKAGSPPIDFILTVSPITFIVRRYLGDAGGEEQWIAEVQTPGCSHGDAWRLPRADCIAWLDSRVLALRAALMPKDARTLAARAVADKRVALAVGECESEFGAHLHISWTDEAFADAVLAALGIAP